MDETPRLKDPISAYAGLHAVVKRLNDEIIGRNQANFDFVFVSESLLLSKA